jgi:ABC-type dipeptide/oligopeptide/nickel transport system ATPase subunit
MPEMRIVIRELSPPGSGRSAFGGSPERELLFRARGLTKIYLAGDVAVRALNEVDLDLFEEELVVLLGPSGSGKSTLLNILGGLDVATGGRLTYRGEDLTLADEIALTQYRRDVVGFIFQFYNLIPSLTARENVELITEISRDPRIRHRYVISPPVAGFLRRVELRPGASIEAGRTVLATIEPQMSGFLDARSLAQAEAAVKAAEATKMQRQAELDRANTALDLANKDLARADALRRTGAIAAKDWDAEQNRVQMLTRELHAAEFALRVAEFEVTQAEAALMQARHADSNSSEPVRVLAPVDGADVVPVLEQSSKWSNLHAGRVCFQKTRCGLIGFALVIARASSSFDHSLTSFSTCLRRSGRRVWTYFRCRFATIQGNPVHPSSLAPCPLYAPPISL